MVLGIAATTGEQPLRKPLAIIAATALAGATLLTQATASARPPRTPIPRVIPGKGTAAPSFVRRVHVDARAGGATAAAFSYLKSERSRFHIAAPERTLDP